MDRGTRRENICNRVKYEMWVTPLTEIGIEYITPLSKSYQFFVWVSASRTLTFWTLNIGPETIQVRKEVVSHRMGEDFIRP